MTTRLYFTDSYLREFRALVEAVSADGLSVYLDRTAFYPTSGGQPHDLGTLNEIPVLDVIDEGDRIAHVLAQPHLSGEVTGVIDWIRRFDHMQQHTGQHVLSAVFEEMFALRTLSVHFGPEASTIDLETDSVTPEQLRHAEARANEIVFENRTLLVAFEDHAHAESLRKPSEREGELRIVSIERLDRSACGGTHVRATGEIGPIFLRKLDKIRGNVRLEFLCGRRAIRRARTDFDVLTRAARVFSSPLDDVAALAEAQAQQLRDADKVRRKLSLELAQRRGRELYGAAPPDASGRRLHHERLAALDDEVRALAQSFVAGPLALFVATGGGAVLLAVSADSGVHAGNRLKQVLSAAGGRGGGGPLLAQGSLPGTEASNALVAALLHE